MRGDNKLILFLNVSVARSIIVLFDFEGSAASVKIDREAQVPFGSYQDYCNAESLRKLVPSMVDIRVLGRCILITVSLYSDGGGQLSLPQIKDLNPRSDSLRANDSIIFVHFNLSPTSLVDPLVEGGQDDGGSPQPSPRREANSTNLPRQPRRRLHSLPSQ